MGVWLLLLDWSHTQGMCFFICWLVGWWVFMLALFLLLLNFVCASPFRCLTSIVPFLAHRFLRLWAFSLVVALSLFIFVCRFIRCSV